MAHWFHRNPIKATEKVTFDLKTISTSEQCKKICSDLSMRREELLELFKNASNSLEVVEERFEQYMSLFAGFVVEIDSSWNERSEKKSKLAPILRFRWTSSILGNTPIEVSESWFEVFNMSINMALWLSKHASWIAAKDEIFEGDAKKAHTCLRRAAGIFVYIQENADKVSGLSSIAGSDFCRWILSAYIDQYTAEAQEITVARAIELKHSASLISALSCETSRLFLKADESLAKLDVTKVEKWRCYLQLKTHIYTAYAYAYLGESLLAEDRCGEAVRACKEGVTYIDIASDLARKYAKANGSGVTAKPESHLFFRRVRPLLERHLEKAERENGFIYHQRIPLDCPELQIRETYGLVEAEKFTLPQPSPLWKTSVYSEFDLSKAKMPDFSKVKVSKKSLPAVKEEKVYETERDPDNHSGCVVN